MCKEVCRSAVTVGKMKKMNTRKEMMEMEKLVVKYVGDLRVESTHQRSGTKLLSDAPVDNHGQGRSFSPTDLLCSAAASCMLTIMGIAAQTGGFSIDGTTVAVTKEMAESPRRIGKMTFEIDMRGLALDEKSRKIVERSAQACPVMQSLHPSVEKDLRFIYE